MQLYVRHDQRLNSLFVHLSLSLIFSQHVVIWFYSHPSTFGFGCPYFFFVFSSSSSRRIHLLGGALGDGGSAAGPIFELNTINLLLLLPFLLAPRRDVLVAREAHPKASVRRRRRRPRRRRSRGIGAIV